MRKAMSVAIVCLALAGLALAEDAKTTGPLDAFAKLTSGTKTARIEIKLTGKMDDVEAHGAVSFAWDTDKGLYRIDAVGEVDENGKKREVRSHINCGPDGTVTWEEGKDARGHANRAQERKTEPGKFVVLRDLGPALPFVDAAFGYPHLSADTVLKPAKSPLGDKDGLQWLQVQPKEGDKSAFLRAMYDSDNLNDLWIGFSAKTGWPMALVIRGKDADVTLTATDVNTKPDLKGVFDLPADVKAQLEHKQD